MCAQGLGQYLIKGNVHDLLVLKIYAQVDIY